MTAPPPHDREIAIYLPDLSGGGAERLHVQLAAAWRDMGYRPRFLLDRRQGALLNAVPPGCPVDSLDAGRQLAALPRLVRWLRLHRPAVLIANMEHMNVMAVTAGALARVPTRIIVTQHNALSQQIAQRGAIKWRALPALYRRALPRADAVVAVSHGVAQDMAALTGWPAARTRVIHNGLVDDGFAERAAGAPDHRWFAEGRRVIVAVGRLTLQKDFATLLRAMPAVDADASLVILGEGPERQRLEALVRKLALEGRVAMPGFVANPLPWLRAADLMVMSSRFEGFGNVLVEALACGTPVVSTDCPHGPAEILDGGRFGALVPVQDPLALAAAIQAGLAHPPDPSVSMARGRSFTVRGCASRYATLFRELGVPPGSTVENAA